MGASANIIGVNLIEIVSDTEIKNMDKEIINYKQGDKVRINYIHTHIDSATNKFGVEPQCSWLDVEMYLDSELHTLIQCDDRLGFFKELHTGHLSEEDYYRLEWINSMQSLSENQITKIKRIIRTKFIPLEQLKSYATVDIEMYKDNYPRYFETLLLEAEITEEELLKLLSHVELVESALPINGTIEDVDNDYPF